MPLSYQQSGAVLFVGESAVLILRGLTDSITKVSSGNGRGSPGVILDFGDSLFEEFCSNIHSRFAFFIKGMPFQ